MECLVRNNGAYSITEREKPVPGKGQMLIRVSCVSLNRADFTKESPLTHGRIAGSDVSGEVLVVGEEASEFSPGDEALGVTKNLSGGCAEYAIVDAAWAAKKPASMTFEEAAALPSSAVTAWAGIKKLGNVLNKNVLVMGASGGVGQYATLLLSALGATVTAACGNRNLAAALEQGAAKSIDYKLGYSSLKDGSFDAIIAVNGSARISEIKRLLAPNGTLVLLGTSYLKPNLLLLPLSGKRIKVGLFFREIGNKALEEVASILANGAKKPLLQIIDGLPAASIKIPTIVAEHPRGKVVIRIRG